MLFGGDTMGDVEMGDTWEWNGSIWVRRTMSGPSARARHAMAYDSHRGVTVLFGGNGTGGGETWEWDGNEWTLVSTEGPPRRTWHSMTYDSARGVVVLFGGEEGYRSYYGDTWEWDGARWRLTATDGPSPRAGSGLAYDSAREVVVLFGGLDGTSRLSDTWEWNGSGWIRVAEDGPHHLTGTPRPFSMAYDLDRNVTVLVGSTRDAIETWQWDGRVWQQVQVGAPTPRWDSAMAYDSLRKAMVIFSGSLAGWRGDTWELAFPVAPQLTAIPACPYSGNGTIEWSCSTPNGTVAVAYARNRGQIVIPPGKPCAGTILGLGGRALQVAFVSTSDSLGNGLRIVNAPRTACGGLLQLVDLSTCATSNVVEYE